MTTNVISRQTALNDHLSRDPRVVSTHLPKRLFARHAVITRQQIHNRILKRMPHMQATRHIRRRNHNAISFIRFFRRKSICAFPTLVNGLFDFRGLVLSV